MKSILIGLIIVGLFLQAFNKVGILVSYQINKEYISKNLCENRDKPLLHCNGKCHLAKQLQKADSEDTKNGSQRNNLQDAFNLFSARSNPLDLKRFAVFSELPTVYAEHYSFQHSVSLYHPPTV